MYIINKTIVIELKVSPFVHALDLLTRFLVDLKVTLRHIERLRIANLRHFLLSSFIFDLVILLSEHFSFIWIHNIIFFVNFTKCQGCVPVYVVESAGIDSHFIVLFIHQFTWNPSSTSCVSASDKLIFLTHIDWIWVTLTALDLNFSHLCCHFFLKFTLCTECQTFWTIR